VIVNDKRLGTAPTSRSNVLTSVCLHAIQVGKHQPKLHNQAASINTAPPIAPIPAIVLAAPLSPVAEAAAPPAELAVSDAADAAVAEGAASSFPGANVV
jgi:hypothetical protein